MYKTNKEIIDALTAHFLESDLKEIARAFANTLLDVHRLEVFDSLPIAEQICLMERMTLNVAELTRFSKEDPRKGEKFITINMNHDQSK